MRYCHKWLRTTLIMSQRWLLFGAVCVTFPLPFFSQKFEIPLALLFASMACLLVWLQEIIVIQLKYRPENVEFTKRFNSKFSSPPSSFLRYGHIFISLLSVVYILATIGFIPNLTGKVILFLVFMTLIRVFDPLLGCLSSIESISWTSMVSYLVVLMFSISSGLDPSKLDIYQIPIHYSQSILLTLVVFTTLNLRMAYYQKFCFLYEQSLESQLRLILIPLLFLSVHQMVNIFDSLDIGHIFMR